jgi:thiol-disulfide isomerase/thioredoxin
MSEVAPRSQRPRWLSHLGTVVLMLVVFLGVQAWQTRAVPKALDAAILDLTLPALQAGQAPETSSLRAKLVELQRQHPGQNVALYVWAQWCPICKTTQGTVNALGTDQAVLTLAMQSGGAEAVARYQQSQGLTWHTLVDPGGELAKALGFSAVPGFAVITPDGELHWPTVGWTSPWGMRWRLWWA